MRVTDKELRIILGIGDEDTRDWGFGITEHAAMADLLDCRAELAVEREAHEETKAKHAKASALWDGLVDEARRSAEWFRDLLAKKNGSNLKPRLKWEPDATKEETI